MRVLLFGNSTWCLFNFREGLIRELVSRGHDVCAIAPLDPTYNNSVYIEKLEKLGVKFYPLSLKARNKNPFGELLSLVQLFMLLRRLKPDCLLTYTVKCNLYAGLCRQVLGFKQIANIPGMGEVFSSKSFTLRIVFLLYKVAFRGISAAFFQNRVDMNYCSRFKMVPAEICRLIPGSGVNLSKFTPSDPPRNTGKIVFLMFGRLLPQKGYGNFISSAKSLKQKFGDKVECIVMGIEDKNRTESTALLEIIKAADKENIIRYIPAVVDVVPLLAEVDVAVLPSRYNEGIPRSLLEALASGKIIITTDWRGCRDTVEQGVNGVLINPSQLDELLIAMEKIVDLSEVELRKMGVASRKMAESRFDEQIVIDYYLKEILETDISSEFGTKGLSTNRPRQVANS